MPYLRKRNTRSSHRDDERSIRSYTKRIATQGAVTERRRSAHYGPVPSDRGPALGGGGFGSDQRPQMEDKQRTRRVGARPISANDLQSHPLRQMGPRAKKGKKIEIPPPPPPHTHTQKEKKNCLKNMNREWERERKRGRALAIRRWSLIGRLGSATVERVANDWVVICSYFDEFRFDSKIFEIADGTWSNIQTKSRETIFLK